MDSLLASEIFSSSFTEGEIFSRRTIKRIIVSRGMHPEGEVEKSITNFIGAYNYIARGPKFSISSFFYFVLNIDTGSIKAEDELEDGHFFRHDMVFIDNNKYANSTFKGFEVCDIENALTALSDYLNNSDDNLFLKAVIGYVYFEMIHPYFDFNGRTGRFIPAWLFAKYGAMEKMFFFSTAIGNYRKQYLSLFNANVDTRTFIVK